ncbi:MarR family transcriptional regulator [Haloarculaceae archaeon H-GB1-1]|nr:MarR family transcriptional regulator [Haloarculaceae archaeon H-GB1-1]
MTDRDYVPHSHVAVMRPKVEWMNQTDDRILELLDESKLALSPSVIAHNLDYSRSWISRRASRLHEASLLEKEQGSYYRISEMGEAYLAGTIDAESLSK